MDLNLIIFFGGGVLTSLSEFYCLTPVPGQFCVRVEACDGISDQEKFIWVSPVSLGPLKGS